MTIAILGASDKSERYSHRALQMLVERNYEVIPVHPAKAEIEGIAAVASLDDIDRPVDTVTVYLRPETTETLAGNLVDLSPRRVIFNPGTESEALASKLQDAGILVENACTLVMLSTGAF